MQQITPNIQPKINYLFLLLSEPYSYSVTVVTLNSELSLTESVNLIEGLDFVSLRSFSIRESIDVC